MDRYVHVTDKSLVNAVRQFETATPTSYEKRAQKGRRSNLKRDYRAKSTNLKILGLATTTTFYP